MARPAIILTGASGFIGSAVCIDLAKDYKLIAMDRREPSAQLRKDSGDTLWYITDISDNRSVLEVFAEITKDLSPVAMVIHFAAYYDFGSEWGKAYQKTNVTGTANVLNASIRHGVKRFIFASSIAAMEPPAAGAYLTEESPTTDYIPYAKSKTLGEELIREKSGQIRYAILRIAGVYSDWCELAPLYGIIKLWTSAFPIGNMIPGHGDSGIPYIHVRDLVRLLRQCILLDRKLEPTTILLASPDGAIAHRQLFPAIRSESNHSSKLRPIHISERIAKPGVRLRQTLGKITGNKPYEYPWMLNYLDRPWSVDSSKTREILGWECTPELGILHRIPVIMRNLHTDPFGWEERNKSRIKRGFIYS